MSILDNVKLPESADAKAVAAYLAAQERKSFENHGDFFDADVVFNGLVLKASGAKRIAEEMSRFLPAVKHLAVDAAVQVEEGDVSRFLVLYQFQLQGQDKPQPLCDHITVSGGRIARIDNVFDVSLLPQAG